MDARQTHFLRSGERAFGGLGTVWPRLVVAPLLRADHRAANHSAHRLSARLVAGLRATAHGERGSPGRDELRRFGKICWQTEGRDRAPERAARTQSPLR